MQPKIGVFNMSESFEVESAMFHQELDLNDGLILFDEEEEGLILDEELLAPLEEDDKSWQDEKFTFNHTPQQQETTYIEEMQTKLNTQATSNPLYLGDNYLTEGEFEIDAQHLKTFYDNAIQLDKKDTKTCITLVAVNNFCFVYSINIGVQLSAFFGCNYANKTPLVVTLPINKILKLLNTEEPIRIVVEEDSFYIKKSRMNVSIGKSDVMYAKECSETINQMYDYYDQTPNDELSSKALKSMLATLSPYARMNQADNRLILLDGNVAYVKSTGYYVFENFKTNSKYLINNTLSQLLLKLCDTGVVEEHDIKIFTTEDTYIILANNYLLKFPILNGDFKFNLIGKIQPTVVYSVDKKEFKTALEQIDLYTEKKCAVILGDTSSLQNKTVQGTAYVEIVPEKLEDSRPEPIQSVYEFDYNKLTKVLAPIKTDNLIIMECNTREHLYLTDQKMSFYVILSVK